MPALVSADHMTPLEVMNLIDEMSYLPGFSSSARRIGFAKASPTMAMLLTRAD